MIVEYLPGTDPQENAAREESLFRHRPFDGQPRLLFYTNRECVQCGRNQDPAWECDLAWCRREGIPVLRRISGGGTVWHDPGNQNYAFLLPREMYSPERILALVVEALRRIGVTDARFCSRYSVWHGPWKISGSAFALSGPAALLHGCLPFTADLSRLERALQAPPPESRELGRGKVASVRSPVTNIAPLCPEPELCRQEFCRQLTQLAQEALTPPSPRL